MLYLVRFDNALKIGYTSNLVNRLNNFKTTQLNVELVSSREGSVKHEKILHELCSASKLRNELFKDDPIVIQIFNNHMFNDNEVLIYDIKNKQILTKYFHPAKSYPEGNKNIKYYYYDSECNIKYEDIMNIKSIVIDNFCQK